MKNEEIFKEARRMLLEFVRETAKEKKITHEQLASMTGFTSSNVSRMLMGRYAPSLDNFLRLADAVGVNFFIESKDSDSPINEQFEKDMEKLGRRKPKGREN